MFGLGYGAGWLDSNVIEKQDAPKPHISLPPTDTPSPSPSSSSSSSSSSKSGTTYTVQSGDTLGTIADQYGLSVSALANYNNISPPYTVTVGQTLTIPGK